MGKALSLTLALVLLLCHSDNTDSHTFCPYKCHCFTPVQVLCAEGGLRALPRNLSQEVKEFIIISSDLMYLFQHSLADSPQLTRLVFLNNGLQSIHSRSFEHLTELQELEVSGNPAMEHLLIGTFANQRNLKKLILNFNKFKTVLPGIFDSLKQLETLQMKANLLSDLPALLFQNLHNLLVLDLSQNKLEGVTREMFSGLASLEILKLNYNLISNLTSMPFQNISQLLELHLEGNMISELSDGLFSKLTNLTVLNLRGNLLTSFSNRVFGLSALSLTELNLKGNRLTELSPLTCLTSLANLILSSNRFSTLPEDTFRNLTTLEHLDLSENQLTSLPETIFSQLFAIQSIHLNMNNLSKVDAKLFEDQVLIQQLYLSHNRLQNLPVGLLDTFAIQHTVRLHGNPWKCDCHMWYLHDWVLRNGQDIEMLDRMQCASPGFLWRRPVVSIDRDQLVCPLGADQTPPLSRCSQEVSNNTLLFKCKVDKCSPLTVRVQFQEDDGRITEQILKKEPDYSQCGNVTEAQSSLERR